MTATEVFLIMTERYVYEDNSGRDTYEFTFDHETDPGFFTTKEAAQGWIDKRTAEAQSQFDAKTAEYETSKSLHEETKRVATEAWEAYKVATEAAGAQAGPQPYIEPPRAPRKSDFFTEYQIVAIEREG